MNGEKYEKLPECIGAGSFGKVYVCEQIDDPHKQIAVKIEKRDKDYDDLIVFTHADEMKHDAYFHKLINGLGEFHGDYSHTSSQVDNPHVICMKYHTDILLSNYCFKSEVEFLRLFIAILEAADQKMHSKNIVHGDIKDCNLFINFDGYNFRITFIDFGHTRFVGEKTFGRGTVYHAPELKQGYSIPADISQDIYSLASMSLCTINRHRHFLKNPLFARCDSLFSDMLEDNPKDRPSIKTVIATLKKIEFNVIQEDLSKGKTEQFKFAYCASGDYDKTEKFIKDFVTLLINKYDFKTALKKMDCLKNDESYSKIMLAFNNIYQQKMTAKIQSSFFPGIKKQKLEASESLGKLGIFYASPLQKQEFKLAHQKVCGAGDFGELVKRALL